jgi:hypothetical protein
VSISSELRNDERYPTKQGPKVAEALMNAQLSLALKKSKFRVPKLGSREAVYYVIAGFRFDHTYAYTNATLLFALNIISRTL